MIYLFSHQLVQLDRHQIIRLAKGKTNRQYLREVGPGGDAPPVGRPDAGGLRRRVLRPPRHRSPAFRGLLVPLAGVRIAPGARASVRRVRNRREMESRKSKERKHENDAEFVERQIRHVHVSRALSWLLALALASAGLPQGLQTVYGQRSGPGATESVNGTAVFAEMFEAAGHRVSSWSSLSPRLDQADCVVWFPDDFQPPSPGVVNWFEELVTGQAAANPDLRRPRFRRRAVVLAENGSRRPRRRAGGDCRSPGGSGTCLSVGSQPNQSTAGMPLVQCSLWRGGRPRHQRHRRYRVDAQSRSVANGSRIEQPDVAPAGHGVPCWSRTRA